MVQPRLPRRVVAEHEALGLSQQVMVQALFGASFVDVGGRFASAVTTRRRYIEYSIAIGDKLYIVPYTLHRHPAWYAYPERFDPDRFLPDAMRARPRFTRFPFGGGARQHLGEPLARMEASLVLAALLRRFRLEPFTPVNVPLRPSIVLEPRGGLPMRLRAVA